MSELTPPSTRPVVFTGSSIIAQWGSLPKFLAGIPVINTAVSGSQTADILERYEELVVRHAPRMVCYYCGSNDINNAVPPGRIVKNVQKLQTKLQKSLPDALFVYLAIIKAPQKMDRWDIVDRVNNSLSICDFPLIDINPVFFHPDGRARDEFYVEDRLHLTVQAYSALEEYLFSRLGCLAGG
jgi:lysophospholipase L1-like esterase